MTYGIVLRVACIVLPLIYVFATDASPRAKALIAGVAFASFWLPDSWTITTILVQLAVCLFVLLYLKAYNVGTPK
jgi:hypothetical protein